MTTFETTLFVYNFFWHFFLFYVLRGTVMSHIFHRKKLKFLFFLKFKFKFGYRNWKKKKSLIIIRLFLISLPFRSDAQFTERVILIEYDRSKNENLKLSVADLSQLNIIFVSQLSVSYHLEMRGIFLKSNVTGRLTLSPVSV